MKFGELARKLDINVAERQPFPGPGLAVRTLGELTPGRVAVVREACAIVEEEFEAAAERGEMELPWQYFAALLPVRSVGVHGDVRAYGETVVVRAVQSMDGMSARYSEIPSEFCKRSTANHQRREERGQSGGLRYHPQTAWHH